MPRFHEANKPKWVSVSATFYVWLWFCCNKHWVELNKTPKPYIVIPLWWEYTCDWMDSPHKEPATPIIFQCHYGITKLAYRFVLLWQYYMFTWRRHQMETFPALLALCVGNSQVNGEFPSQRLVTWSFQTPSRSLRRHSDEWIGTQWLFHCP